MFYFPNMKTDLDARLFLTAGNLQHPSDTKKGGGMTTSPFEKVTVFSLAGALGEPAGTLSESKLTGIS